LPPPTPQNISDEGKRGARLGGEEIVEMLFFTHKIVPQGFFGG